MNILVYPRFKAFKDDNSPAAGWKVLFYQAGTTTPQDAYSDSSLAVPVGQVELDGSGEADIWLDPSLSYKVVVTDENDVVQRTVDSINTLQDGKFSDITGSTLAVSGAGSFGGQVTSTVASGTAPFVVASTTKVANLNADDLDGHDWANPSTIGVGTPNTGAFTTLSASSTLDVGSTLTKSGNDIQKTAANVQIVEGQIEEEITLSTSGTTTDSAANLLPANSYIKAVAAKVTQAIVTATDWKVGDGTQAARFCAAQSGAQLNLNATKNCDAHLDPTVANANLGPQQASAAKIRITTTGTPSAGKIRVTVFYRQVVIN